MDSGTIAIIIQQDGIRTTRLPNFRNAFLYFYNLYIYNIREYL